MKIIEHLPEPQPKTYDILGLTEDQMYKLQAVLARVVIRDGLFPLWDELRSAFPEARWVVRDGVTIYLEKVN